MAKNLIFCFDGTGNEPGDAEQRRRWLGLGALEDDSVTNVFKLHLLLGGDLRDGAAVPAQRSFYYSGVGTYGRTLRRIFNAALAPANADVGSIIREAREDLKAHYQAGDQVLLFGFSRGAAIARRFAAVINDLDGVSYPVRFVGVFDTVASIGVPNLDDDTLPVSDVVFENQSIAPNIAEALHLLSLDERRKAFRPTLMNRDARVTEVWLAGVHSDVGGGFRRDGLSDLALELMLDELKRRDLGVGLRNPTPANVDYDNLAPPSAGVDVDYDDVIVQPNPLGHLHAQHRPPVTTRATLATRLLRVNEDDQALDPDQHPAVVHASVVERIHADPEYRPAALRHTPHRVWGEGDAAEPYAGLAHHLMMGARPVLDLEVGESAEVTVHANQHYNRSRVMLRKGQRYVFTVAKGQVWYDSDIPCGPEGWSRDQVKLGLKELVIRMKEDDRRHPKAKWFELIGSVGASDREPFRILQHRTRAKAYKPKSSGELCAFANDLERFYSNNLGFVRLTVERVE
jgi:hypothetical protein